MTNPQSPQMLPAAGVLAGEITDDAVEGAGPGPSGPTVGAADAEADAARSGADVDPGNATRDSDGVPVGEADLEADKRS